MSAFYFLEHTLPQLPLLQIADKLRSRDLESAKAKHVKVIIYLTYDCVYALITKTMKSNF